MFRNKVVSLQYHNPTLKRRFIQNTVRRRLTFLKWIQLAFCTGCLLCASAAIYLIPLLNSNVIFALALNAATVLFNLGAVFCFYFGRFVPSEIQVVIDGAFALTYCACAVTMSLAGISHPVATALTILQGFAAAIFLTELMCKILMTSLLRQTTRVTSVKDVAITAFVANPPLPRPKRSPLTAIPISYGGTFPVGKDLPPFLPEETVEASTSVDYSTKTKLVQVDIEQRNKGTSAPFAYDQQKRKKSMWTCASASPPKKQPQPTPITYSGTFAVNRYTVPFTNDLRDTSPKGSPRTYTLFEREVSGNSGASSPRNLRRAAYLEDGTAMQGDEHREIGAKRMRLGRMND
ncbi:uncharacterized protein LOC132699876 [Cylas formicarius]|uniref:uncharacterized protein LOC132699876 n=1 Tax=Cylas formicarius TaxID=197179 RepID=UPI002958D4F1|nr:uncharacterized protein LOC132699876 [Cylas formicarius]